jgi:hypothetical protein
MRQAKARTGVILGILKAFSAKSGVAFCPDGTHTGWASSLVLGLVLLTLPVSVQTKSPNKGTGQSVRSAGTQKTNTGTVAGRVFAITKSGDLKPARLASVYLFFNNGPGVSAILEKTGNTPALVFLQKELDSLKEGDPSCRRDLVAADKGIDEAVEWAKDKKVTELVRFTDADEDGYFEIEGAKPGIHDLVVRGQAGSNDAFWDQQVEVKANQKIEVKVASVQAACSNLD